MRSSSALVKVRIKVSILFIAYPLEESQALAYSVSKLGLFSIKAQKFSLCWGFSSQSKQSLRVSLSLACVSPLRVPASISDFVESQGVIQVFSKLFWGVSIDAACKRGDLLLQPDRLNKMLGINL